VSRLSMDLAWRAPFSRYILRDVKRSALSSSILALLSFIFVLHSSRRGRRLAGRVLTVAALTPLAHSLRSGAHTQLMC